LKVAKEILTSERMWKIIEENTWFGSLGPRWYILKHRDWRVFTEADGIYLRDIEGKEYIDGSSGFYCCTLGHGNRRVIEAIKEQIDRLQFAPAGHCDVSLLACERVAEVAPPGLNRVALDVTGSDAVESSLVYAREYFRSQGKPNHIILTQWLSYHGASYGAAGATGMAVVKLHRGRDVSDINSGFYYVPPPYCYRCAYGLKYPECNVRCAKIVDEVIEYSGPENVAGFLAEPVFGTMPGIAPPPEYWPIVREICDKHKILLIFDEVITGWGRLGKLWASEFFNITPDIMVTAKGITGAYLPLSATILSDHVCEPFLVEGTPHPWLLHTHSFHPAACAASLASIDVLMEGRLWENAAEVGAYLKSRLEGIAEKSKIVGAVHGVGLLLGVEIVADKKSKTPVSKLARRISLRCAEKGLILDLMYNELGVAPPLIITKEQSDRLCDILDEAIAEIEAERR